MHKAPKPKQLKREQLKELQQRTQPQPIPKPEPVWWKPLG